MFRMLFIVVLYMLGPDSSTVPVNVDGHHYNRKECLDGSFMTMTIYIVYRYIHNFSLVCPSVFQLTPTTTVHPGVRRPKCRRMFMSWRIFQRKRLVFR